MSPCATGWQTLGPNSQPPLDISKMVASVIYIEELAVRMREAVGNTQQSMSPRGMGRTFLPSVTLPGVILQSPAHQIPPLQTRQPHCPTLNSLTQRLLKIRQ